MTSQYTSRILVIPGAPVSPSPDLPKLYSESLDFKGSLMLVDPSHPWDTNPIGTSLKNNLWGRALEAIGSTDQSQVGGESIELISQGGGAYRNVERTSKSAMHLYYAASSPDFSGDIARYNFPAAILNHIKNSGHEFYIALSHRITYNPQGLGNAQTRNQWSGIVYNDNLAIYSFDTQSDKPNDAHRIFYNRVGTANDTQLGLVHRAIAIDGTESTENHALMFGVGRNSNWTNANGKPTGSILYTFYVCDLTVANKTAAEVDAIFQARQAALFATGGRYANDTWTDPATK